MGNFFPLKMALRIFNTLGRRKEILKPLEDKIFRYYSCGPTVYDYPHIGNWRAFILADTLKKYLKFKGFKVRHVMNITDVDDKIIKKCGGNRKKLVEITRFYEEVFLRGMKELNIDMPDILPRATENIQDMRDLIQKLIDRGYAYLADDNSIYYDVSKFEGYGKLSGAKIKELKAGARVRADEYEKEEASDFALWKAWKPEDNEIYWEPEFEISGKKLKIKGRPGWHIECSAMSMKYLGESFDIHSGGVDLIFPHHENEIAQSEAATGKKFVRYWLHNELLLVEGKKMSKRYGNIYTLEDLKSKGYAPLALRYLYLTTHYRDVLNFTWEALEASKNVLEKIQNFYESLIIALRIASKKKLDESEKEVLGRARAIKREVEKAMDDDLNTPVALSKLHELIDLGNSYLKKEEVNERVVKEFLDVLLSLDSFFSLIKRDVNIFWIGFEELKIREAREGEIEEIIGKIREKRDPKLIEKLLGIRQYYREKKEWGKADLIREKLKELGVIVNDLQRGFAFKII